MNTSRISDRATPVGSYSELKNDEALIIATPLPIPLPNYSDHDQEVFISEYRRQYNLMIEQLGMTRSKRYWSNKYMGETISFPLFYDIQAQGFTTYTGKVQLQKLLLLLKELLAFKQLLLDQEKTHDPEFLSAGKSVLFTLTKLTEELTTSPFYEANLTCISQALTCASQNITRPSFESAKALNQAASNLRYNIEGGIIYRQGAANNTRRAVKALLVLGGLALTATILALSGGMALPLILGLAYLGLVATTTGILAGHPSAKLEQTTSDTKTCSANSAQELRSLAKTSSSFFTPVIKPVGLKEITYSAEPSQKPNSP
jgi:hypothetical protein